MSDNWIVQNLNSALNTWNEKLAEIWTLLTQSPESFKGGTIWSVITGINGALTAIGYGLLGEKSQGDGAALMKKREQRAKKKRMKQKKKTGRSGAFD